MLKNQRMIKYQILQHCKLVLTEYSRNSEIRGSSWASAMGENGFELVFEGTHCFVSCSEWHPQEEQALFVIYPRHLLSEFQLKSGPPVKELFYRQNYQQQPLSAASKVSNSMLLSIKQHIVVRMMSNTPSSSHNLQFYENRLFLERDRSRQLALPDGLSRQSLEKDMKPESCAETGKLKFHGWSS